MPDFIHDVVSDKEHAKALEVYEQNRAGGEWAAPTRLVASEVPGMSVTLSDGSSGTHSSGSVPDYAGNIAHAWVMAVGNDTWIQVQRTRPDGVMDGQWEIEAPAGPDGRKRKISSGSYRQIGAGIYFVFGAYNLTAGQRTHYLHRYYLPNVLVAYPGGQSPEFGTGAMVFMGDGGGEPVPGITDAQIEAALRRVLGVPDGRSLLQEWGGDNQGKWRQVIEDKVKSAAIELLVDEDPDQFAQIYQHLAFNFHKNANANPLANVLGAHDAWGAARQEELKEIIRDSGAEGEPTE